MVAWRGSNFSTACESAKEGPQHEATKDNYLAVFLSNKTSPRWQAWYAMTDDERRGKDEEGFAALKAWDEAHQDDIVYIGGPLGKTKRTSQEGVADVVNELTVFVVVRAPSPEAADDVLQGFA